LGWWHSPLVSANASIQEAGVLQEALEREEAGGGVCHTVKGHRRLVEGTDIVSRTRKKEGKKKEKEEGT
jgi:hypothetical protein